MAHRLHHPKQAKQTADDKIKEFDYIPDIQYIMPEKDIDGEEMYDYIEEYRNREMHDGDYIEWCETVEDCVKYITPKGKYNYELTITFNRTFHTIPSMHNLDKHLKIIKYYVEECLNNKIEEWYGVLEYQKKAIGALKRYPPHYHFIMSTEKELEPCELQKTICAFWRHFGKCDFKPVMDMEYFTNYLCKNNKKSREYGEFIKNIKTYKRPHLFIVNN